jgi:proteic killer suppression protein
MLKTFSDSATHKFIVERKSKFAGMDVDRAWQRLNELQAATSLESLGKLNSVGLHKLNGSLKDFWSIDVNGPWRIIFKFRDGDAFEVKITDTH